jgi:hypothetical protein
VASRKFRYSLSALRPLLVVFKVDIDEGVGMEANKVEAIADGGMAG